MGGSEGRSEEGAKKERGGKGSEVVNEVGNEGGHTHTHTHTCLPSTPWPRREYLSMAVLETVAFQTSSPVGRSA